ncbi:MAG: signal recognition particle-docking protein FtsY [Nitrososphaeraceae archaeon]
MFEKLKKAFSDIVSDIGKKEISKKDLENTLLDLEIGLLESDVAQEVITDISTNIKSKLLGVPLEKGKTAEEIIQLHLKQSIYEIISKSGSLDLVEAIKTKKEKKEPFVVVFLGINGTGKTTTVAKIANLLRKNDISVVLAAGDTHRAGAIEQLQEHAKRLSLKMIHQRYGADPSAVARDAVEYGKKHRVDAILIDTAGRMQTAKNLMDEINKIVQVVKPDMKIFIGDSLAGNDAIFQATEFYSYTKFDGAILTKTDADSKGGSILSISYLTSKPIMYLGVGQNYDDIILFDIDQFIESLFNFSISPEITNNNTNNSTNSQTDNKTTGELTSINSSKVLNEEIYSKETSHQSNFNNGLSTENSTNSYIPEVIANDKDLGNKLQYHGEHDPSKITKRNRDSIGELNHISDSTTTKLYSTTAGDSEEELSEEIESDEILDPNLSEVNKEKKNGKKSFFSIFGKQKSKYKEEKSKQKSKSEKENLDDGDKENKNAKKDTSEKKDVVYLTDDDLDDILKE